MPLLLVISFACFAGALSIRLVDPIIPEIARDFAVSPAIIALLASAFTFPYALGQPLLGPMGDSIGKARVIQIGLAVLAVCLVATAIAPTLEIMFVARALAGLAGGAIIPVALAMVGDRIAYEHRQVALSQILSAMLAAQFISLIGSGMIATLVGWRYSLALGALVACVALVVAVLQLKPRPVERTPFTLANVRHGYQTVFSNPKAWVCYVAVFIEGIAIFGLLPYIAVMLEKRGAGGVAEAGFVIAGMGVGGLVFTFLVKHLLRVLGGMSSLIRLGGVFTAAGFAGIAMAGPWLFEAAAFVLLGFGFYAIHNSLQTQATELAPEHRGSAVALHAFFFFLGHAAGPPIYAAAFATIGPNLTILGFSLLSLVGAFVLAHLLHSLTAKLAHRR